MSIIKKSSGDVLLTDVVRGLKQQGVGDDDLIAGMGKAGIPDSMARSLLSRVTEELEVSGLENSRSVVRMEIEAALSEWSRGFDEGVNERLDDLSESIERINAESKTARQGQNGFQKELESLKGGLREIESSVKSFEIFAKEILKTLKK